MHMPNGLLTPSFLSADHSFSLNLLGLRATPACVSYSTPNIFKADLSDQLGLLSLGINHDDLYCPYTPESPLVSQRLSIWSTPYREDAHFMWESKTYETTEWAPPKNIYSSRLSTPPFVPDALFTYPPAPGNDTLDIPALEIADTLDEPVSFSDDVDPLSEPRNSKKRPGAETAVENRAKEPRTTPLDVVVSFSKVTMSTMPPQPCNKYILDTLRTKEYAEDYCSTFYKRNVHGYMFVRESSSSLKVNLSGGKSWVTIKLKLGVHDDTHKVKVDVKKLPVWKPINLNLTSAPRRPSKRDWKKPKAVRRKDPQK